ncbi:MAG: class I SAM-dependent methyltransferase [bacterium]|nr:class I SAM-dependent methyltransferase [bacterium]
MCDCGVDLSDAMLNLAYANAQALHLPNARFERADAKSLPYPDGAFATVISNSLIHHLSDPVPFFNEAARVATPNAAILFRDIRRPPPFLFPLWWRWFGRHYSGQMLRSYQNSLRAAFTPRELAAALRASNLRRCRLFRYHLTHIGIVRPASSTTTVQASSSQSPPPALSS